MDTVKDANDLPRGWWLFPASIGGLVEIGLLIWWCWAGLT